MLSTLWRGTHYDPDGLPPDFVCATDVQASGHVEMQAALQPFVDNCDLENDQRPGGAFPSKLFKGIYDLAYERGLKGCTTYRPNPVRGAIVTAGATIETASHCCVIEREAD
jgi:ribonucleoside-diphosphate reductase alpha chain